MGHHYQPVTSGLNYLRVHAESAHCPHLYVIESENVINLNPLSRLAIGKALQQDETRWAILMY